MKAGEIKRRAIVIGRCRDDRCDSDDWLVGAASRARDHISPLGTIIQHSGSQVLPIT
jgi:hypothetical protein